MGLFLTRRLFLILPVLAGLVVLVFALTRLLPADPAAMMAGENATATDIESIRIEMGLDRSFLEQAWVYVQGLATGDLGESQYTHRAVVDDIADRLPATVELSIAALVLGILLGVPLGLIAAEHHNRTLDHIMRPMNVIGLAIAPFWLAMMLQLLFSMELDLLPLQGRLDVETRAPPHVTGMYVLDALLAGQISTAMEAIKYMILPAVTMAAPAMATLARFTRSSALEALQQEYVAYARAIGLPWHKIFWKYVLRNSLSATVTQIGLLTGALLSGSVIVEALFNWPGLGQYLFNAITTGDYQPVIATTLVIGLIYAVVNLLIDVLQGVIDPRIVSRR